MARLRLVTVLLCAIAAAVVVPAAASAQLRVVEPAGGAAFERGSLPWLAVEAADATHVRFLVSSRPRRADGMLAADVAAGTPDEDDGDGTFGWRLPARSIAAIRPGRYWWQAVALTEAGDLERGPVSSFEIRPPAGASDRGPIPRRFGRQGSGAFAVSLHGIPREVSRARLWAVVSRSARRWGLRAAGWTRTRPVRGDGFNVLGFGRQPPDSFGVMRTREQRRYRRTFRCRAGQCVEVARRYVGTVVIERDVVLNDRLRWEAGPAYPWLDEADLESVVIHELGHFAGNRHVGYCSRSPMAVAAQLGDWWRSPLDRFTRACTRVSVG